MCQTMCEIACETMCRTKCVTIYLHARDRLLSRKEEQEVRRSAIQLRDSIHSTISLNSNSWWPLTIMRTTAAGLQMTFNLYRCHSKVGHLYVCLIVEEQIFRFKVTMTGESEWKTISVSV